MGCFLTAYNTERAARRRRTIQTIFHSDRGSEYLTAPFRTCGTQLGFLQSASRREPEDNSHMESFFHSLKAELIRGTTFHTATALRKALREYIRYYNYIRMHSALGYRSPIAFERLQRKTCVYETEARSRHQESLG
jgi:putative transposase